MKRDDEAVPRLARDALGSWPGDTIAMTVTALAVLAFAAWVWVLLREAKVEEILVWVGVHWKAEYQDGPSPVADYSEFEPDEQRRMVARHLTGFVAFTRHPNDIVADAGATRLRAAYEAFLPVGRVLVERGCERRRAILAGNEVQAALDTCMKAPAYTPNILLRLMALALSEEPSKAKLEAKKIVDHGLGVPLTQRWAARVLEGLAPFEVA